METSKSALERSAFYGISQKRANLISELVDGFLEYARYELNFSPQTAVKYKDSLNCVMRHIGDIAVENLDVTDVVKLKRLMIEKGLGSNRIASVIYCLRSFLNYCRTFLQIDTIHPKQVRPPKRERREVIFLNKEEIEALLATINVKKWNELRFRTLVEILLGTGMRIGEALSLNRKDIDWKKREAKIVGKGNKERRVFFTQRSLDWVRKYLESRSDNHEAIFVTKHPIGRLNREDIWRFFDRHRKLARIDKKLTPHILRHTVATNLVFNGCPIVHVKEILGHERLDTTCKYYLGVNKELAKKAHKEYLTHLN